jgi:hypothetical protein
MMWSSIRNSAVSFHQSFHGSWVIWIARVQMLLGAIWAALTAVDLAPLIGNPKYVTAWLVFSGMITEYGRRSGTYRNDHNQLVPCPPDHDDDHRDDHGNVTVVVNSSAAASPVPTVGLTK